jgi:hypothetical protein
MEIDVGKRYHWYKLLFWPSDSKLLFSVCSSSQQTIKKGGKAAMMLGRLAKLAGCD